MTALPESLKKHFKTIKLKNGEHFIQEGQISKYIGYVESGLLRSYQIDQKGESVTTNFFYPGSFCGSFYSFYEQEPSFESIEAITPVQIKAIGYNTLHELFRTDLTTNQIVRKAIEGVCISKDIRISKMLKLDARDRYIWLMTEYPIIIQKAPLKHVASYLNMKPETISRIRKKLIS